MGLLHNGFELEIVEEVKPSKEMMDIPGMEDELRRPMMLLVKAIVRKNLQTVQSLFCIRLEVFSVLVCFLKRQHFSCLLRFLSYFLSLIFFYLCQFLLVPSVHLKSSSPQKYNHQQPPPIHILFFSLQAYAG